MSLSADDVREIMRLLEESAFDELDLETDGFRLTLRRTAGGVERVSERKADPLLTSPLQGEDARNREPATTSSPSFPASPERSPGFAEASRGRQGGGQAAAPANPNIVDVPAPLLGVFYRAPKPGAQPYVDVGQRVEADTVIAIIEVMKLMNSVRAGVAGEVVEIVAQNAAMVEYGQTLIRVRTGG